MQQKHAQVGNEERQESNKDIPSMPANARNMNLESKPSDVGREKKPNRDGHEVIAHTNKDDAVCNLEYNVHYNFRTKGNKSPGHGQTEVQQQVFCC